MRELSVGGRRFCDGSAEHNRGWQSWDHPSSGSLQGARRRDPAGTRRWELPETRGQELVGRADGSLQGVRQQDPAGRGGRSSPGRAGGSTQGALAGAGRGAARNLEGEEAGEREVGARPAVEIERRGKRQVREEDAGA
jgi:hypothetical protein